MKIGLSLICAMAMAVVINQPRNAVAAFELQSGTITSGGGIRSAGTNEMLDTIGLATAGNSMSSQNFSLFSGFPAVMAASGGGVTALTVTVTGLNGGGGTVTSSPAGISCTAGNTCSSNFTPAVPVQLSATPDANSLFLSWSLPECPGTGVCSITPVGNVPVTALFSYVYPVRIGATPFGDLSSAFASAAAGATIEVRAFTFNETLAFSRDVAISLNGGYNLKFDAIIGPAVIQGKLAIAAGRLTANGVAVR